MCQEYAEVKCPVQRESYLAQKREYMQHERDNYTPKEMIREYERSAQRQREIIQRGVLHGSLDRRLIPEGRKCNIDDRNLTTVRYFNV